MSDAPNIAVALTGPEGAGKSTVGVLLAERLGMSFVDFDVATMECNARNTQGRRCHVHRSHVRCGCVCATQSARGGVSCLAHVLPTDDQSGDDPPASSGLT